MPYDDLPLHPPTSTIPPPRRRRGTSASRWVIVGAGAIVAGSVLAFWWMGRAQPPTVTPAPVAPADPVRGPKRPERQPMQLPALSGSDAMLRELVGTVSRHPLLARFLATRGLVRGVTLSIVQIGDGRTPADPLSVLRPETRVQMAAGDTGRLDPASYARWNAAARALQSVPAADAAQIYVNVKPLFDDAYRDLGYPDANFDDAIAKAIRMLDATPEVTSDPVLLRRDGYFEHDDQALRSLLPVQKQLILMGPANRAIVMIWLRQLAAALELSIAR